MTERQKLEQKMEKFQRNFLLGKELAEKQQRDLNETQTKLVQLQGAMKAVEEMMGELPAEQAPETAPASNGSAVRDENLRGKENAV